MERNDMPEKPISLSPSAARFLDTSRRYLGLTGTQRTVGWHGHEKGAGFGGSFAGQRVPVPLAAKS